jgi:hypothetical protein
MFDLERNLPALTQTFRARREKLFDKWEQTGINPAEAAQFTSSFSFPTHHIQSEGLALECLKLWVRVGDKQRILNATKVCMLPRDSVNMSPDVSRAAYWNAFVTFFKLSSLSEGLEMAKIYSQRAVRTQAILHGREVRNANYDHKLAEVLSLLPFQTSSLSECAFCWESPLKAYIPNMIHFNQVMYCSEGCQTAHLQVFEEKGNKSR